ncbi:hypothetical protein [Paracoccus sp. SM22M-07]|uniref:hypothetical protein n=1 Tax=Paracoccus sp. SM22M-07 TaxID=1520813 RepID=UPI00197D3990|nr:hypothetical protein [Paracoccus sp. SM22M-07]
MTSLLGSKGTENLNESSAMIENQSRQRREAEIAFDKTKSPRNARDRAFDDIDAKRIAGEEKTARLREARLSRQATHKASHMAKPALKNAKRR